jgi:adenine-specific DNA-methyltransferase
MATQVAQKHLGAFYTSSGVAQVLVDWAVRSPNDLVLDPACGEGVFLDASAARLSALKPGSQSRVYGVEIDRAVLEHSIRPLLSRLSIPSENVIASDFFDVGLSRLPQFDAVVGNPPFIRYQTFKGPSRDKALAIARRVGVNLSELASSWAPFILHATEFLRFGGRLAMVVPAEFTHATYARPVVQYLAERFSRISLAGFVERLFPELNQDTFLVFAEGYGGHCREFRLKRFERLEELVGVLESGRQFGRRVSPSKLQNTNGRLRNHFLPREVGALYEFLAADSRVCRLGELAQVGIGYVTGGNQFFHMSKSEASFYGVPDRFLRPTLLRSGIVQGLRFTQQDWASLRDRDEKVYLLALPRLPESQLPKGVREYLAEGRKRGVHTAYKCTVRQPWYSVPHSDPADAFLTYMSGDAPRVAWNCVRVLATNSTHEIRFRTLGPFGRWRTAVAFCCSLSQLSSEIEGHPLGGGMLKLEPTEAERALVVRPELVQVTKDQFEELDTLIRSESLGYAIDLADELILRDTLGLTWDQIQILREGLREFRETRRKRIAAARSN